MTASRRRLRALQSYPQVEADLSPTASPATHLFDICDSRVETLYRASPYGLRSD